MDTLPNLMSYSMVKGMKTKTYKELGKERTDAVMSVVLSLEWFELSSEFEESTDWQCIKSFLCTADEDILSFGLEGRNIIRR